MTDEFEGRAGSAGSPWDFDYRERGRIWGDGPSELLKATLPLVRRAAAEKGRLRILDIDCGYGRDVAALIAEVDADVLAVDPSRVAVEMARAQLPADAGVEVRCCGYADVDEAEGPFDVVMVSALYQLLRPTDRGALREAVGRLLAPGGLLLLSAMSPHDPQHFGRGTPVEGEERSFVDATYIHFCDRRELLDDFAFLDVRELREVEAEEHQWTGVVHHHVWWVMVAGRAG